jgi:ABC-type Zn2+ transport system substrate-binding protein/surface adhesin
MQGVGEPYLLIGAKSSTHHFSFKPSHLQMLERADLVIWIDRYFESGFQKLPEMLSANTQPLELLRVLGLKQEDGHIWYSPTLLLQIADQIESSLVKIDPGHVDIYRSNTMQLVKAITAWDTAMRKQLASTSPEYLLDHDFLIHFERDMNISAVAALHDANEKPPGIRELKRIEKQLQKSPALCLLVNEASPSRLSLSIAERFNLPIYNIGPHTDAVEPTTGMIESLNRLSTALLNCS